MPGKLEWFIASIYKISYLMDIETFGCLDQ
jgi:hypothetical protein